MARIAPAPVVELDASGGDWMRAGLAVVTGFDGPNIRPPATLRGDWRWLRISGPIIDLDALKFTNGDGSVMIVETVFANGGCCAGMHSLEPG
jgi:hypothetical protein